MSFRQELASWRTPKASPKLSRSPNVGEKAPDRPTLDIPGSSGAVLVFLRHCGCPYAERAYRELYNLPAIRRGEISGILVSHSSAAATEKWLIAIKKDEKNPLVPAAVRAEGLPETPPNIRIVIDEAREIYAAWGLGISSIRHVLSPRTLSTVIALGRKEGIWNRPTESGSRWQTAGEFAVDAQGVVRWAHVYQSASDAGDLHAAVRALQRPA